MGTSTERREWTLDAGPAAPLAARISILLGGHLDVPRQVRRTFLDTFDWRLWRAGEVLIEDRTADDRELRWVRLSDGLPLLTVRVDRTPRFAEDLPRRSHRAALGRRLEVRALLPRVVLIGESIPLEVRDDLDKVVLRGEVAALSAADPLHEERQLPLRPRFVLQPIRGYAQQAHEAAEALGTLPSDPLAPSLVDEALAAIGLRPDHYSSRVRVVLRPDERADRATRAVLRRIFDLLLANVGGVRADLDTEFLHALRVAMRRTRSVLGELGRVFAPEPTARFSEGFRWLGRVTGPTRDLDVFLLALPSLEALLAPGPAGRLEPLARLVRERRDEARDELLRALDTERFVRLAREWQSFLDTEEESSALGAEPMNRVVGERIRRLSKRVVRDTRAVTPATPAESLHDLRKACKKLRHLTEFFGSPYPTDRLAACLAPLEELQSYLGTFQDLEVQSERLVGFSGPLLDRGVSAEHLMSVGVLVDRLGQRRAALREGFSERFDAHAIRAGYASLLELP